MLPGRGRRLLVLVAWTTSFAALAHCGDDGAPAEDAVPLPDRVPRDEAGAEAGALPEADAPRCDDRAPFGAPALVAGLDPAVFAATPRLSPDELTIYFTTLVSVDGARVAELVAARRASRSSPFGPATVLTALGSPQHDNDPMIASDLLSLWFSSSRSGNNEIYVARRASPEDDFDPAAVVPGVGGPSSEMHPYYRSGSRELWLTSNRDDGGFNVYVAPEADGSFAPPAMVGELSTPYSDLQPALREDGLAVVLASDRDGGAGGYDLWLARRASTSAPFGPPEPVAEVNSSADDYAGWLSPDACRIYFSSNRGADAGNEHRLYVAERSPR